MNADINSERARFPRAGVEKAPLRSVAGRRAAPRFEGCA